MLTMVFLSTLLMAGGLGGAAASDLQVSGKSIHSDKTFIADGGKHTAREEPHRQTNSEILRSLDLKSFNFYVTPASSKIGLPTIIKLYPPTDKPLHLYANMPMRFGRNSNPGEERTPNMTPNMPQRFGRSWEVIQMCAKCPAVQLEPKQPQRLGRNSLFWSLLRTLANAPLLSTSLKWTEDFDITTSSKVMEMQEQTYNG